MRSNQQSQNTPTMSIYRGRWVQDIHLPKSHEIISSISLPFSMQLLFKSIFLIWSKCSKVAPKKRNFHPAEFLPQKFAEMHVPALVVHHWWPVNTGNQGPRASKFHLITPPKPQLCGEVWCGFSVFAFWYISDLIIITSNWNLNSNGFRFEFFLGEKKRGRWKVNMEFENFIVSFFVFFFFSDWVFIKCSSDVTFERLFSFRGWMS